MKNDKRIYGGKDMGVNIVGNSIGNSVFYNAINKTADNQKAEQTKNKVQEDFQPLYVKQDAQSGIENTYSTDSINQSTAAASRTKGTLLDLINEKKTAPYSALADDSGMIAYEGATFICDSTHNRLCLGDVSNENKCLSIPLTDGGSLVVNRDNLGELAKAIRMFSPKDINRIMTAIAQDNKTRSMQKEIDDAVNSLGKSADKVLDQKTNVNNR